MPPIVYPNNIEYHRQVASLFYKKDDHDTGWMMLTQEWEKPNLIGGELYLWAKAHKFYAWGPYGRINIPDDSAGVKRPTDLVAEGGGTIEVETLCQMAQKKRIWGKRKQMDWFKKKQLLNQMLTFKVVISPTPNCWAPIGQEKWTIHSEISGFKSEECIRKSL